MEFECMNKMAARFEPMPDKLSRPERMAYMKLQLTYAQYAQGVITREDGTRLKAKIAEELATDKAWEAEYVRACTVMKVLRQSDVPAVKAAVREVDDDPLREVMER